MKILFEDRQVELYNLPFEATNFDILNLVPELEMEDIQMPMRTPNKNKGFCLITFKSV